MYNAPSFCCNLYITTLKIYIILYALDIIDDYLLIIALIIATIAAIAKMQNFSNRVPYTGGGQKKVAIIENIVNVV